MVNDQMVNISEISAELLLTYLYPELTGKWMPQHVGTFYRNYNSDVMALYPDEPTVVLSRDGFLKLLPGGLFDGEDKQQMKLLRDAFLPLDAYWFNTKLQVELQVSQLLQSKLSYILREYFQFDWENETDPLVHKAATILPFVRSKRGDFAFIRDILASLVHCPVEMETGRYSDTDTTVAWIPKVRYNMLIPDLTPEQYRRLYEDLQPLFGFIREWFIPAEIHSEFEIKEHTPRSLNQSLTLNYNSELKDERMKDRQLISIVNQS